MANEQLKVGTELANLLEQRWSPTFAVEANEAYVIGNTFSKGEAQPFGNALNISKVATAGATVAPTTNAFEAAGLVYEADTEANIAVSPRFVYAGFQLSKPGQTRFLRSAAYQAAKKRQLLAALRTDVDTQCAVLGASLATNIVGGVGQRITKALLTQALGKLRASAKEYFQQGGMAYLRAYHLQWPDLYNIPDITAANLRGDNRNPNVTGRVIEAWGLDVETTGNLSVSGGVAHNMLYIPEAFVLAYNQEPVLEEPQKNGLLLICLSYAEHGEAEVWDEYAVDIQSSTT